MSFYLARRYTSSKMQLADNYYFARILINSGGFLMRKNTLFYCIKYDYEKQV